MKGAAEMSRHTSPRRRRLLLVLLVAVAIAAMVGATIAVATNAGAQARVEAGQDGRAFAVETVPEILSYQYDTVDEHFARVQDHLGGDFKTQFDEVSRTAIVPSAKKREVVTTAEVVESAVVSTEVDKAELLLFLNQTTTSSDTPESKIDGSRVRVYVERTEDDWLITEMTPV